MIYEDYPDPETGELPSFPTINCETGEFELTGNFIQKQLLGKPFKIPRNIIMDDGTSFEDLIKSQNSMKSVQKDNITDDKTMTSSKTNDKRDLPPVYVIGQLLTYLTSVLKVFLSYCLEHKFTVINNLRFTDIYYQNILKRFFRDVVPFLKIEATKVGMRQLKRKGLFRCGLHYVKRVKIA